MQQGLQIPESFKRKWDEVEQGWWYRVTGQHEVHLSFDVDLGWEISVRENGEIKTKPYFRKDLQVAINVAEGLFLHYQEKQPESEVTA